MMDVFDLRAKADVRAPKLSGGMRRRLLLARALMHEPRLVILDEPTAGVDFELRLELWRYIRRLHAQGTTILLTTHYLEEAEELCEEIALIRGGRALARDTADGLRDGLRRRLARRRLRQGDGRRGGMSAGLPWLAAPRGPARPEALDADDRSRRSPPSFLFILVFGLSLSGRIRQRRRRALRPVFIVPGLITMAMVQAAYANNSCSVFQARFDRYLNDILAAPMRPWEINLGLSLGGAVRALLIGVALLAARAAGRRASPVHEPLALALAMLLGARAVQRPRRRRRASTPRRWDHAGFVNNILILPLTFLGGVFYSVDRAARAVAASCRHANPIFYLVQAVRYGFLGTSDVQRRGSRSASPAALAAVMVGLELMAVPDGPAAQALAPAGAAARPGAAGCRSCWRDARSSSAPRWPRRSSTTLGPGGRVAAAPRLRGGRPDGAVAPARARRCTPRAAAPRALFGLTLGADEPLLLRGAGPHPARRRGDDRVRRAARRRRLRLAPARWTWSGRRWPPWASSCSPTRSARTASTPLGLAFILVAGRLLGGLHPARPARRRGASAAATGSRWPRSWPRLVPLGPGIAAGRRGPPASPEHPRASALAVALLQLRRSPTRWRPRRCGACPRTSSAC